MEETHNNIFQKVLKVIELRLCCSFRRHNNRHGIAEFQQSIHEAYSKDDDNSLINESQRKVCQQPLTTYSNYEVAEERNGSKDQSLEPSDNNWSEWWSFDEVTYESSGGFELLKGGQFLTDIPRSGSRENNEKSPEKKDIDADAERHISVLSDGDDDNDDDDDDDIVPGNISIEDINDVQLSRSSFDTNKIDQNNQNISNSVDSVVSKNKDQSEFTTEETFFLFPSFECFGFDVDIEEDQLNEFGPHETEDASNASVFPRANQNNTVINEFMIEEQPLEFPTDTQNAASERLEHLTCLLYTSPSPRDATLSRMPSSA